MPTKNKTEQSRPSEQSGKSMSVDMGTVSFDFQPIIEPEIPLASMNGQSKLSWNV